MNSTRLNTSTKRQPFYIRRYIHRYKNYILLTEYSKHYFGIHSICVARVKFPEHYLKMRGRLFLCK